VLVFACAKCHEAGIVEKDEHFALIGQAARPKSGVDG